MTRNEIITELTNRGYKVEVHNVIKNGVEMEGVRFIEERKNISPVIYVEQYRYSANPIDEIIATYENSKGVEFDTDILMDRDYVLSHLYIGLQREGYEDIVKKLVRELKGIEKYLYVRLNDEMTTKVTPRFLESANVSKTEAWKIAEKNTFEEAEIKTMGEMLGNPNMNSPFFVMTNKGKTRGASAVLNKKLLKEFCISQDVNAVFVVPSSIHEVLIIPYSSLFDLDALTEMVKEVNATQVEAYEQLTDRAYKLTIIKERR